MEIFRQKGEMLEKYSIVSVDRDRVYKDKKRFGKWYSKELSSLVEKLLDGDYTVTAKILNLPPQRALTFRVKTEEWIKTEFTGENMLLEDYFRAVKFFNDYRLPNVASENDNLVKLYNGYFYDAEDTRLVKYGVKSDSERLVKLKVHIMSVCESRENATLIKLIDALLAGDFAFVPDIIKISNMEKSCACPGAECSQYYSALRHTIKIEEFVSISNSEFEDFTSFLNIDCPEDHAPVKPKTLDAGDSVVEEPKTSEVMGGEALLDTRLAYAREQLEAAIACGDSATQKHWESIIQGIETAIQASMLQPQSGKQM